MFSRSSKKNRKVVAKPATVIKPDEKKVDEVKPTLEPVVTEHKVTIIKPESGLETILEEEEDEGEDE